MSVRNSSKTLLRHLVVAGRASQGCLVGNVGASVSGVSGVSISASSLPGQSACSLPSTASYARHFPSAGAARNFSVIPSSWKAGKDDVQDHRENQNDQNDEIDQSFVADVASTSTALSSSPPSPDAIVDLGPIAESAALEAAMEGAWLPTRTLQYVLESVHHATGLEWWQSIMLTTVGIRAATLPVMLMQIKNTYRLSQARPEVEHLVARLKEEQARGNQNATADYQQHVMAVWKKYNCNPLKSMASIFVQAPLFIGFFSALRGLAAAKVPSMVEGGTLWFSDLTVADPTYALPVISAGTFLLMVELNAADGMEGQTDKMRKRFKNIMRGVAVLIVPFTLDLPAAVFMYWSASNMVSLVQSSVLKVPAVKRMVGIPVLGPKKGQGVTVAPGKVVDVDIVAGGGRAPLTLSQKPKAKKGKKGTKGASR